VLGQATGNTNSLDSPRPTLGGSHHLPPYIILCIRPQDLHSNGFLSRDSQGGVLKLSRIGLIGLKELITPSSDLWLGWDLKQSYSCFQELSNDVLHSTWTHQNRVDSWLLMVGNQNVSLTLGPSFDHNLCCKCPKGYARPFWTSTLQDLFQQYKEHLNTKCFDPYNQALSFWDSSWRTPSSHFWECEFHPHIYFKVGLRHLCSLYKTFNLLQRPLSF
jgi:hypothetical protein